MIATVTLEERGGRTLFKNRLNYKSKMDRDGHLQSGMERGLNESLDRLEEVSRSVAYCVPSPARTVGPSRSLPSASKRPTVASRSVTPI
jgi:hypothetical protein